MIALSTGLTVFSEPLLLVVLIALVFGALEGERAWTRSRRRRGLEPGAVAYLLDGLVIIGAVLALVGAAMLFVEGLTSIAALVGGVIDGERVGLLIVGMALALGLALALARAASGRRAAQDAGHRERCGYAANQSRSRSRPRRAWPVRRSSSLPMHRCRASTSKSSRRRRWP